MVSTVGISAATAHASAAATDRIPASKAPFTPGTKGYLTASQIADYVEGRTTLAELIRDTIGATLVAGTNITITVNDGADTITVDGMSNSAIDERARDAVGTALVAGTGINITVNDGADTITIAADGTAVSALTAASALDGTEFFHLVQSSNDRKALISAIATYCASVLISDTAYNAGTWDAVTTIAASKNAVRDKIEAIVALLADDTAFASSWDAVTTIPPSKNAVYDALFPALGPPPVSGNWFHAYRQGRVNSTNNLVVDRIYFSPSYFPRAFTLNSVAFKCTTASAATNVGIAIYANNPATGRPTGAPLAKTGNMSTASTGNVTSTLTGGDVVFAPGWYWVAFAVGSSTPAYLMVDTSALNSVALWPGSATLANIFNAAAIVDFAIYVSQSFNTASWPDVTAGSFTEAIDGSALCPAVCLKAT